MTRVGDIGAVRSLDPCFPPFEGRRRVGQSGFLGRQGLKILKRRDRGGVPQRAQRNSFFFWLFEGGRRCDEFFGLVLPTLRTARRVGHPGVENFGAVLFLGQLDLKILKRRDRGERPRRTQRRAAKGAEEVRFVRGHVWQIGLILIRAAFISGTEFACRGGGRWFGLSREGDRLWIPAA
jgi:hypothetical protein